MSKISLAMIVKNEEDSIRRCLESVHELVDEIIIVDTGSTDMTKSICSEFNAKIYDFVWTNDFSEARNFSISKTSYDWVLILDADEYVVSAEIDTIKNHMKSNKGIGVLKRINFFKHGDEVRNTNEFISRLLPKYTFYEGTIHEQVVSTKPRVVIDLVIEHDGYMYESKFDRNIELLLNEYESNENDSYICYQIARTYRANKMHLEAKPFFEKFYSLIDPHVDAFAEDGIVFYINNTIDTKDFDLGLQLIESNFSMLEHRSDFHFACGVFFMEAILHDSTEYSEFIDNIEISYLNALSVGDMNVGAVCGTGSYLAAYNLGLYYEMNGHISKAIECYNICLEYDYVPAKARIDEINRKNARY